MKFCDAKDMSQNNLGEASAWVVTEAGLPRGSCWLGFILTFHFLICWKSSIIKEEKLKKYFEVKFLTNSYLK